MTNAVFVYLEVYLSDVLFSQFTASDRVFLGFAIVNAINTLPTTPSAHIVNAENIRLLSLRPGSVIATYEISTIGNVSHGIACSTSSIASSISNLLQANNPTLYASLSTNVAVANISCPTGYTATVTFSASCPHVTLPACQSTFCVAVNYKAFYFSQKKRRQRLSDRISDRDLFNT